uniref:Uncharacterized protein n=1 Tax=Triticum urartu TaxID=4572 RepID=A0A8R7U935_TRIUA
MAECLASIFGTEKGSVNCPFFYFKIGACHHGDRLSSIHNRPTMNMYQRSDMITSGHMILGN